MSLFLSRCSGVIFVFIFFPPSTRIFDFNLSYKAAAAERKAAAEAAAAAATAAAASTTATDAAANGTPVLCAPTVSLQIAFLVLYVFSVSLT